MNMTARSPITTHVLDTRTGLPAVAMAIELESLVHDQWRSLGHGVTDANGRITDILPSDFSLSSGRYRMTFETGPYFQLQAVTHFYPLVVIEFEVHAASEHYHIPLLISPFGYSTYRGS
jgi:5-hydroxyisourate hydrolase